jgi:hypothetical protein
MPRSSYDPELQLRGRLVRRLGAWREMLPGSFVAVRRTCGKPNCRCADGVHLHLTFQLSVLVKGQPRSFHVPARWADEVRAKVEMSKRFHETATTIAQINLRRFLRRKKEAKPKTS